MLVPGRSLPDAEEDASKDVEEEAYEYDELHAGKTLAAAATWASANTHTHARAHTDTHIHTRSRRHKQTHTHVCKIHGGSK